MSDDVKFATQKSVDVFFTISVSATQIANLIDAAGLRGKWNWLLRRKRYLKRVRKGRSK